MSVIVGSWNETAGRLYDRARYSAFASEPAISFSGCPHKGSWILLTKSLKANA